MLRCSLPHVTVVSPRNYFMFTPLLPMVAVGTLVVVVVEVVEVVVVVVVVVPSM